MKLKIFNEENSKLSKFGFSTVRINVKGGLFSFSKEAANVLNLHSDKSKTQVRISFVQDEESPSEWYIKHDQDKGFPIRYNEPNSYDFNSTPLAKAIVESIKLDAIAVGFSISKTPTIIEGVSYYAIITSNPLNIRK